LKFINDIYRGKLYLTDFTTASKLRYYELNLSTVNC